LQASMLYGKGTVWVNGHPMPASSAAVFAGDSIETKAESLANVNAPGSSIALQPNTLVKIETGSITLEHGSLSVVTSNRMTVRAGDVSATPGSSIETEFEATDSGGQVQIVARRNDTNVVCGNESIKLAEGQEVTRDEAGHCKKGGAYPPATGNILESRWTWVGLLGGGGLCAWLCPGVGSNPPISAFRP